MRTHRGPGTNTSLSWGDDEFHAFDDNTAYTPDDAHAVVTSLFASGHDDSNRHIYLSRLELRIRNVMPALCRLKHRAYSPTVSGRALNFLGDYSATNAFFGYSKKIDIAILDYMHVDVLEKIMNETFGVFDAPMSPVDGREKETLVQQYRTALLCVVLAGADYYAAVEYFRAHINPDVHIDIPFLEMMIHNGDHVDYSDRENTMERNKSLLVRKILGPLAQRALDVPTTSTQFLREMVNQFHYTVLDDDSDSWEQNYQHLLECDSDDIVHIITTVFAPRNEATPLEHFREKVSREIELCRELVSQTEQSVVCSAEVPKSWDDAITAQVKKIRGIENRRRVESIMRFYLNAVPDNRRDVLTGSIEHIVSSLVRSALPLKNDGHNDADYTMLCLSMMRSEAKNWKNFGAHNPRFSHLPARMMGMVCDYWGDDVQSWIDTVSAMMRHGVTGYSNLPVVRLILTDPIVVRNFAHQWTVDIAENM